MCRSHIPGSVKHWIFLCGCVIAFLSSIGAMADERDGQAVKYYRQGEHYFQKERYQEALSWYEKALEQRAQDGPVMVEERIVVRATQYGHHASSLTQDDTLYEDYAPNKRMQEIKTRLEEQALRANPPVLSLTWIALREPTHDDVLDGGETATIVVNVQNSGIAKARDVTFTVRTQQPDGLTFEDKIPLGDIDPAAAVLGNIQVKARKDVVDQNRHFTILATEHNGFDSPPLEVVLRTRPHRPARVEISDLRVEDRDNNGVIEPLEVVTVTARIQNSGAGLADHVVVQVLLGPNVFLGPQSESVFSLGELYPGQTRDVQFTFLTNNQFRDGQKIPVSVLVEEGDGQEQLRRDIQATIHVKNMGIVKLEPKERLLPEAVAALSIDVDNIIPDGRIDRANAIAVVIGNKDYSRANLPSVEYALRDAQVMTEYLVKALGFSQKNIIYLENATTARFNEVFGSRDNFAGRLYSFVTPDVSDVYIYYAGHGAPDLKSKGAYFVPVDADPNYLALSGYALDTFYKNLSHLPARSITVILDTCFSGNSAGGALFKNVNPTAATVARTAPLLEHVTIFASAGEGQVSSWYYEQRHSLYTYFFLKGLSGVADANQDGLISARELHAFLLSTVPVYARKLGGQEQVPVLIQKEDVVVMKYREAGAVAVR